MKFIACTLAAVATTVLAIAQAPERAADSVYREAIFFTDGLTDGAVFLRADGTYATITASGTGSRISAQSDISAHPPETGTYSYTKTGSNSARLTFNATGASGRFADGFTFLGGNSPKTGTRIVTFNTSKSGSVTLDTAGGAQAGTGTFNLTQGPSSLMNSSMRGVVRAGKPLVLGFVVTGEGQTVLVRGIGPSLSIFNVPNPAQDPSITLHPGNGAQSSTNEDWSDTTSVVRTNKETTPGAAAATMVNAFATTGAFALPAGSKDAAIIRNLRPGSYTVEIKTVAEAEAEVLGEIYIIP